VLWQHSLSAYYSIIRQVQFARIYRVDIVGDTNHIIPVWLEGVVCCEAFRYAGHAFEFPSLNIMTLPDANLSSIHLELSLFAHCLACDNCVGWRWYHGGYALYCVLATFSCVDVVLQGSSLWAAQPFSRSFHPLNPCIWEMSIESSLRLVYLVGFELGVYYYWASWIARVL
jgi:hypothetical protein